jgi:hypothetical protein
MCITGQEQPRASCHGDAVPPGCCAQPNSNLNCCCTIHWHKATCATGLLHGCLLCEGQLQDPLLQSVKGSMAGGKVPNQQRGAGRGCPPAEVPGAAAVIDRPLKSHLLQMDHACLTKVCECVCRFRAFRSRTCRQCEPALRGWTGSADQYLKRGLNCLIDA